MKELRNELVEFEDFDNFEDEKEIEIDHVPVSDGVWEGEKGNSKWLPDNEKIPEKKNPEGKAWGDILEEFDIEGIDYINGEPDFSEISRGEAHISDFTENRYMNFKQADEYEAERRGCSREEVANWREDNNYTWHERKDCETMDKVPSIVHNNMYHTGGISEKKKELELLED